MTSHEARQINALEFRVDQLQKENQQLRVLLRNSEHEVAKYCRAGEFYLTMQKTIQNNEACNEAWREFVTILALTCPNIEELR